MWLEVGATEDSIVDAMYKEPGCGWRFYYSRYGALRTVCGVPTAARERSDWLRAQPEKLDKVCKSKDALLDIKTELENQLRREKTRNDRLKQALDVVALQWSETLRKLQIYWFEMQRKRRIKQKKVEQIIEFRDKINSCHQMIPDVGSAGDYHHVTRYMPAHVTRMRRESTAAGRYE
ncbi:hypothetical protein LSAT2_014777 [Lamellibrachia satsuma]|nr:hypothetical protein LSAT2_014777 [Lamellibrachia satsuma]